jgi:septation ring formation regulator EzrA
MEEQLEEMKQAIEAMHTNFAVDAPDGESDGHIEEELDEVKYIIDHTRKIQETLGELKKTYTKKQEAILQTQTVKWMDPDEIEALFDIAGRQKKEMEEQLKALKKSIQAMKTNYAVDAPDGETDGHIEEELEEVKYIIDHTKKEAA